MTLQGQKKNDYQNEWMRARRASGIELLGSVCVKCGSDEDLEVDHIDPATKVSHRIWSWSWQRIVIELSKCQLLCADHHLQKTREWMGTGAHLVKSHGAGCGCKICQNIRQLEAMKAIDSRVSVSKSSAPQASPGPYPKKRIDRYEVFS